ncbi:hypothetical protein AB0910_16385 [Streptomyces sp. NPDC047002]|uniref:hypothetical protein n=1 Tax=Streptomyces sp. NPDC047002 TaxID=3155475 RepID=UPI003454BC63
MNASYTDLASLIDSKDPAQANGIVKAFAANAAFSAAEWEELTTEDNPYRRPVRPDDLAWLDYSKPMPKEKALRLSALLGHRMLRNVYDADLLYLPPAAGDPAATSKAAFYSTSNRILSALAQPILERHLFTLLDDVREPLARHDTAGLVEHVRAYLDRRRTEADRAAKAVSDTKGRREAATFLMLQLSAFVPAAYDAVGHMAVGEYGLAHPGLRGLLLDAYRRWEDDAEDYRAMLASAELTTGTAAYWQLYLGTSLARGNHLHYLGRNRENAFAFLGAWIQFEIDRAVTAPHLADVFEETLGARPAFLGKIADLTGDELEQRVLSLIEPLVERFGSDVVSEFHRGFADAAWFTELWDGDLGTQVTWADRIEEYQDKAARIDRKLTTENITVDLDTFVETCDETSTTHVHNEHRLVMIESGRMHFWNNVTHKIELNEGDKLLIPVSRLHGSTVLSGSCTYHQPIIPEEMLREFD